MIGVAVFVWTWWCRWDVGMPKIVEKSISILSDAGLGMAMFSLGGSSLHLSPLFPLSSSLSDIFITIRFNPGFENTRKKEASSCNESDQDTC